MKSPLGSLPTVWPIVPAPDEDKCGAVDGMIGKVNQSTLGEPFAVQLCSPQTHIT
jgi:hypothetical protein